jgi:hypothetical protein
MEPFPLSDSRWKSYQGGYRQPFDARPLVEALRSSPNDRSLWDTVWNELHHQGDIGEASYAFVTHLPSLITQAERPIEQALSFAAVVERQRCVSNNPPLPPELDCSYHAALRELLTISITAWPVTASPGKISAFCSLLAVASGQPVLSKAYFELGINEAKSFLKEQVGYEPDDGVV